MRKLDKYDLIEISNNSPRGNQMKISSSDDFNKMAQVIFSFINSSGSKQGIIESLTVLPLFEAIQNGGILYTSSTNSKTPLELERFTDLHEYQKHWVNSTHGEEETITYFLSKNSSLLEASYDSYRKHFSYAFTGHSKEDYEAFLHFTKGRDITETYEGTYMVTSSARGLELIQVGDSRKTFEPLNYSDQVCKDFDYIVNSFNEQEPAGRLVILNGPPGTGKTFFIRGLMEKNKKAKFILMSPDMAQNLDSPNFIPLLIEAGEKDDNDTDRIPLVLILEDADQALAVRGNDNFSHISALLNYTDGMFGAMLDIRVIASTNAASIDFDPAVMRPGRLLRHVEVNLLTPEHANRVLKTLNPKSNIVYAQETTLTQVYADARVSNTGVVKSKKKGSVGFSNE